MAFKASSTTLRPLKFDISTNLLDHIGVNMYSSYPKAIGELVVNGYDADATLVEVAVDEKHDLIDIEDNGSGMDEHDIRNLFMFIATKQKRAIKRTPVYGRLPIGQKGIGKLAGFGIAKRIEVRTVKDEHLFMFVLDRDEIENSERRGRLKEAVLNRAQMPLSAQPVKGKAPGTVVRLTRLRRELGKIDINGIIKHLAQELPQDSTFRILVNHHECRREDVPATKTYSIDHIDPVCGPIKGELVVAKKRLPEPGILVTVRGRVIGRPNWFGVNREGWRFTIAPQITGSIEVPGFDPEERTDEMEVIKTDREGFVETHPKYVALAAYMKARLEEIYRELVKEYETREAQEVQRKVSEAIRHVAQDLNEWERDRARHLAPAGATHGQLDPSGQDMTHGVIRANGTEPQGRDGAKPGIPPKLMEEIKASLGAGRLRFMGRSFEIKEAHLGPDSAECDVRWDESLILVNLDHPAYKQAVASRASRASRCVEIVVFRAIAGALAAEECSSSREMYSELDSMIRFHAERMSGRAKGEPGAAEAEEAEESA